MQDVGIVFSREIHMSDDAGRFTLLRQPLRPKPRLISPDMIREIRKGDYLALHEGKTIHQFSDRRTTLPRYAIGLAELADKPLSMESTLYYRAACREIARSTDERTAIAAMLPPGVLCGHTISVERRPARRPNAAALSLVGIMNSFAFDWLLRQKAATHVSLYILSELPVPEFAPGADRFLAHACLRLCCNHRGFAPLWREQLGDAWREASPLHSWPVIADEADRWRLRAAMDAVVAHAYGSTMRSTSASSPASATNPSGRRLRSVLRRSTSSQARASRDSAATTIRIATFPSSRRWRRRHPPARYGGRQRSLLPPGTGPASA